MTIAITGSTGSDIRKLLFQHDFKDRAVGLDHALGAQGSDILHGLFRRVADDAVGGLNIDALKAKSAA